MSEDAPRQPSAKKALIPAAALLIITATINLEGRYVKDRADPGGETNFGITKATAERNGYRGPMRELPRSTAESIYYREYLVDPGYEPLIAIDAPVAAELFDTTVNMGAARPSSWFEQSTNALCGARLAIDGRVGPAAIGAYKACQPRYGAARLCVDTLNNLDAKQAAEYRRLVAHKPALRRFLKGWLANRIGNVDRRDCSRGH
jgi:lysozyme family protein